MRGQVRHKAAVAYTREIVALPDGGTLALDWVAGATVDAKRPTIILLTGFTGSSEELEIKARCSCAVVVPAAH